MRDRRSTFTKEYINNVVNPLGNRPDPFGTRASRSVVETQSVRATDERPATADTTEEQLNAAKSMLMPTPGLATATETDTLVGAVGGLGGLVGLGAAGGLNGAGVQNKDTTFTKLFVGGLPYHTTDKSLRDHFSVFGDIEEAVVITDRQTGKSRGYGFVIMGDRASAERACKEQNPIIDGRKANVNLAILGAKPRGNVQAGFPFPGVRAGYPTLLPSQYGDRRRFKPADCNFYTKRNLNKYLQPLHIDTGNPITNLFCGADLFRVPPGYVYQSPYLAATAPGSLVPLPATQLTHAAAVAAAATSQFYEYQNAAAVAAAAAAPYTGQYTNGFDAYTPYTGAAGAASYMPYTYAALPQTPTLQGATAGPFPGISYPATAQAQTLQEARIQ